MAFNVLEAVLPAQVAAGATTTTVLGAAPSQQAEPSYSATKLSLTSPALVTGVTTNTVTIMFRQLRAGASLVNLGTLALITGVNLAAEVEVNVPVPVTGTLAILDGDVIDVQCVQAGIGLALPAGMVAKAELV